MTIKSSQFGGIALSGKDAERFIRHMQDDAPSPMLAAALTQGRAIFGDMKNENKSRVPRQKLQKENCA